MSVILVVHDLVLLLVIGLISVGIIIVDILLILVPVLATIYDLVFVSRVRPRLIPLSLLVPIDTC